jgi:hypothetical protein
LQRQSGTVEMKDGIKYCRIPSQDNTRIIKTTDYRKRSELKFFQAVAAGSDTLSVPAG